MWIKIPDDVKPIDHATGRRTKGVDEEGNVKEEILTFNWWLNAIVLRDNRWWVGRKEDKHADAVEKAFADKKPGDLAFIERADWEFLKDVVENPKYTARDPRTGSIVQMPGYENALAARNCRPFRDAVSNALENKPE